MNAAGIYELFNNCAEKARVQITYPAGLGSDRGPKIYFIESSIFQSECHQN